MIEGIKQKFGQVISADNIAKNMFFSGVCKPISIIISYIYVPIAMNYLGVEKYGVWTTILSILSWISYFDIGIGNGLRNKLTESIANHEDDKSKTLISSAYAIISLIMICVSVLFLLIATKINWQKIFGVKNVDESLTQVVCVSVIFIVVNFVLSICKNVLYALQRAEYVSFMELGVQLFNLLGILFVSNFTDGNLGLMAVVYGISMVLVSTLASVIVYAKNMNLRPNLKHVQVKTGIALTNLGVQFFIIQICALVLFTTDNLIVSSLYGASSVTSYSTVNKLYSVIIQVFTALLAPVWSSVTKAKAEHNYIWLLKLIDKLHILMLPFVLGTVLLGVVFRNVSYIWLHRELVYENGLIFLGAVYCLMSIWCNTYAYIANGLELMRVSMIIAVCQAVVNIPLSLVFAELFGLRSTGVLLGTVLSMAISAVISPIYVRRSIKSGKNK